MQIAVDIVLFLWEVILNWALWLGGALMAGWGLFERWQRKEVSWSVYRWIAVVLLLFSFFSAWHEVVQENRAIAQGKNTLETQLQSLNGENAALRLGVEERHQLINRQQTELDQLRSAPPKIVIQKEPDKCWRSHHAIPPDRETPGSQSATEVVMFCNHQLRAPFRVFITLSGDILRGKMDVLGSGGGVSSGEIHSRGSDKGGN